MRLLLPQLDKKRQTYGYLSARVFGMLLFDLLSD